MCSRRNFHLALIISLLILSDQREKTGKFCPSHRIQHPTKCNLFYYCVNITNPQTTYVWVPGKCQIGLVFQPVLGMCVIPEDYEDCLGESDTKITSEMVQDIIKNRQQFLAEEPNLEFETLLEPNDKPLTQTSSYNGGLFDHEFNTNSRLSTIQELNRYHSYPPIQPTSGDKWNLGVNNKKPEVIPPTGSLYLNPEKNKINGGNLEEFNPSHTLKQSSNNNWNDIMATVPPYITQPPYQPSLSASTSNGQNYAENSNNMSAQLFLENAEKSNNENTKEKTNENHNHDNNKNAEIKYQNGLNEAKNNFPIIQRDPTNRTKNINPVENNKQLQVLQKASPLIKHSNRQGGVQCRNRARQPDLSDCKKYYTCNAKGDLTSYNCPYQTAFNAYTQKCDSKVYDDCLKQLNLGAVTDTPFQDEIENTPQNQIELRPENENSQEIFRCTTEGKYEDVSSMQHYFMCTMDQETLALTQYRLICPQNLLFCSERKICTHAEECYQ